MRIGDFETTERVLVIAEIGNNHEGDFGVASELVDRAAEVGVDAVKFQTYRTEHYVSVADPDRFARLQRFELTPDQFSDLATRAHERGLLFISTPFDLKSADALDGFVDAFKISSGDNTFWPLIDRITASARPMIVATGLSDLDQIAETVAFVNDARRRHGSEGELAILHCVSSYPVSPGEAGLRAIELLRERFADRTIGYSDHTEGIAAGPLAVALGAQIVEKHFTLDIGFSDFRDHQLSADPDEMRELVSRIREAETMLGARSKVVQPSEESALETMRRSIVATRDLTSGHQIGLDDLTWVRPGGGLPPGKEELLVGRALVRDVRSGERLSASDVA
jgi:sialic acid synthase SpsE